MPQEGQMPRTKAVQVKDVQALIYALSTKLWNMPDNKSFSRRDKRAMQDILKALAEMIGELADG